MTDERDEREFGEDKARQPLGEQGQQPNQQSGQPIGGNDSNTGSGTALTQGADFGGQSSSGQAQSSGSDKLKSDQGPGVGTQSTSEGSVPPDPTDKDSSGRGFIGSKGSGSDEHVQDNQDASSKATEGSDFADQGRGALDNDGNESDSGESGH